MSVSTELDGYIKEALQDTVMDCDRQRGFDDLYERKFTTKKKKANWSKDSNDRVFLPHKVCLIAQLAGCHAALRSDKDVFWLKVTKIASSYPSATRTKLDEQFGRLATIFLNR
jgi:hypothetical protein